MNQNGRNIWLDNKTFKVSADPSKPKYYVLDMFPYPSGSGLHVGHVEGYTATDIMARYKRQKGFNVLHPMGWDSFGLPAEQYAIRTGTHPAKTTKQNIDNFRRQLRCLGYSYDWDREFATSDARHYKWTQWIFTKLYEKGLAYEAEMNVNFCPALGTVLANEEIENGLSKEGGHPVVRRPLRQWVLKITAYAERLLDDLKLVDWPESLKKLQINWIGKSEGAQISFKVKDFNDTITVFTTRPDTLFGATFMVLAPEHPLVDKIASAKQRQAVTDYQKLTASKSDLDRTDLNKGKSGVFIGAYAINPTNGKEIPIWISDYVLMGYGTGAIMAVPSHDERDFEFAQAFQLPVIPIFDPDIEAYPDCVPKDADPKDLKQKILTGKFCWQGEGTYINSSNQEFSLNGIKDFATAKSRYHQMAGKERAGSKHCHVQTAGLAVFQAKVLGRAFPHPAFCRWDQESPGFGRTPFAASGDPKFQANRRRSKPIGAGQRLDRDHRSKSQVKKLAGNRTPCPSGQVPAGII